MRHLSPRANRVVKLAHEAAQEYGRCYVGTEHLLLGIVREGTSLGAGILHDHGATQQWTKEVVDELVEESIDKGLDETWVTGRLPGSPHFMNVFARAERIAQRLGHSQICSEHLLAALLTLAGSMGYEVLRAMGISMELVERAFREQSVAGCA